MARPSPFFLALGLLVARCGSGVPSDDPADWYVDSTRSYEPTFSEPRFVVPSSALPFRVGFQPSNNNVDIQYYRGRLFMAWRQGETHFAGPGVKMHVVSSSDDGETWDYEHTIALGSDVREPRLIAVRGRLLLYFFQGGDTSISFRPQLIYRTERKGLAEWSELEPTLDPEEVPWDHKLRDGKVYLTSYRGNHYGTGESAIEVRFRVSENGLDWSPVNPARPVPYVGGVSEVAFELDEDGSAWFVTRNEDGDASGFGSHVCHAPAGDLSAWDCPIQSDPERYDSPEMFRHGQDIYLIARRDLGGPFDERLESLTLAEKRRKYALDYWTRPKRTALYKIDKQARRVVFVKDLPSAGDTAFASVRRTGPHTYLVANYSSPLDQPDLNWLEGQTNPRGTQIYLLELSFQDR